MQAQTKSPNSYTESPTPAERRARLLEAAAEVGRNVTAILDLDELLRRTVDIICDAYGFYYAAVFLIKEREGEDWAVLHAGRGEAGRNMIEAGHKLKVGGHSMIGAATSRREARIALDVGQEAVHFKNPHLPLTRSEMALPLIVGDEVIGAISVQSEQEAAFSDDDVTSLQAMADQLAIAIQNARLHQQNSRLLARIERRAKLLAAAAEVGRNVTAILDLDGLLRRTVDIICDAYGFYYAAVFLIKEREGEDWAVLHAGRGEAGRNMIEAGHKLKVGGHSMIGAATSRREARIALDVGQEAVHFKNPHLPLTRSEMALPLIVGDEVIGAISVQSEQEAAFSDHDVTSLQAMADQLAVAIQNARLLADLKEAHRELVRTKTYEAIANATQEAIHWIGNKATPIPASVERIRWGMTKYIGDLRGMASIVEDLALVEASAEMILDVKENLIGPTRDQEPGPVMLQDVVKDAIIDLEVPDEIVTYQVAEDTPLALADSSQMHRVFTNLVKNALEAMEEVTEKQITVGAGPAPAAGGVTVTISDNGCGIPPDIMDKIWITFFTTKGSRYHPGLGLTAVRQILEQMEGQISVESQVGPESGTTFSVTLPAFEEKDPQPLPSDSAAVLIVDDDDAWRQFAASKLEAAGYAVTLTPHQADYGLIGLGTRLTSFDLVLIDNVLEQADALEIVQILQDATPKVLDKTVLIASSLSVERTRDLLKLGVRDVTPKPYSQTQLATVLQEALPQES